MLHGARGRAATEKRLRANLLAGACPRRASYVAGRQSDRTDPTPPRSSFRGDDCQLRPAVRKATINAPRHPSVLEPYSRYMANPGKCTRVL
jgi:hypothetical protein